MQKEFLLATLMATFVLLPVSAQHRVYYQSDGASAVPGSYMESSSSATAHNCNPHGLPRVIHGPAVGTPGDSVSRGPAGSGSQTTNTGAVPKVGLPPCRNSLYMSTPGDGIRSDLGHHISGQTIVRRSAAPIRQQAPAPQQPVMVYNDYTRSR